MCAYLDFSKEEAACELTQESLQLCGAGGIIVLVRCVVVAVDIASVDVVDDGAVVVVVVVVTIVVSIVVRVNVAVAVAVVVVVVVFVVVFIGVVVAMRVVVVVFVVAVLW